MKRRRWDTRRDDAVIWVTKHDVEPEFIIHGDDLAVLRRFLTLLKSDSQRNKLPPTPPGPRVR